MTGAVTGIAAPDWVPPVDFVMEMADSTSPAAIYAHTIWTQLKNCIVFAAGDTFAAGSSGGRANVTLTTNELPTHNHSGSTSQSGAHTHTVASSNSSGYHFNSGITYRAGSTTVTTSSAGSHGHTLTIGSTGSGQAFSILNPYQAVNIWQRVG